VTPAQQIALWADQLRHMAALGLHFSNDRYDLERYHTLQSLAIEMQAVAGGQLPNELEPLRASVFSAPTPFSCGDAAIIDAAGRILLIQRADNQLWAMPGGGFEVGETPAQGAIREAREETGVVCEPIALVGVFDSRLCGAQSRHHLYQYLFLCRPLLEQSVLPSHADEVLDQGWFREDELPAVIDPGHMTKLPYAFAAWRGEQRAFFDS
jgi:8-oxo-dGTP pyrophosphatase MutT (NUDIX family)